MTSFAEVYSRKTERELNYTTSQNILEELRILEKQKGWAIFKALAVLRNGGADSFSFTKDDPYSYFYARITEEHVIFRLKTKEEESEFRLPIAQLI